MEPQTLFAVANNVAALSWLALILLPRWKILTTLIGQGVIGALCLLYAVLVFTYFFRVEGGGFGSIDQVRALFGNDFGLLAGWIHYLAFDLFIGLHVAAESDRSGLSRLLQAPLLVAVFMFGPVGLLLHRLVLAGRSGLHSMEGIRS